MSFSEILVVLCVALIVLGPKRMPEAAHLLGKTVGQLINFLHELQSTLAKASQQGQSHTQNSTEQTSKIHIYDHDQIEAISSQSSVDLKDPEKKE